MSVKFATATSLPRANAYVLREKFWLQARRSPTLRSDKCAVVTEGVCVDAEEPKTCGNEKLDEGEVCDGDKFAEGKRVCPEGKVLAEGKTESDITCSDKCALVTEGVCVDAGETKTCGNGKLDEGEICDGDKFAEGKRVCPDGLILASGKTEADIKCSETCTLDTGEACKPDVVQKCDGTKLCLCDGYEIDCICEDCAAKGETCDVVNGVAMCIGEKCTYDGSDKYICKGDFVVMCMADVEGQPEGHYLVEKNCAAEGQICSEEGSEAACVSEMCGEQDVDKAICKGSVRRICLATGDGSYAWLGEDCSEKGQICEDGECVDPPTCGNGFIDDGEKCDPNADPMIPSWLMADCYYYSKPNREDTTYEVLYKSGAPTCTQTCAITVNNCVKAVAGDYTELKKWSFSSMNDITSATQSKIVVMHDIFGSGMSEFSDKPKGWSLGNWGKTAFAKWIEFKVGSISKNAVKVVVDVTRKNNSKSPEKFELRIQYKKGSETKTVTTHEVVFSDMETHQMTVLARGLTNASDLSVGFTAYGTDSDAHVVINNIVVSEIDAL